MAYYGAGVLPFYVNNNNEIVLLLFRETRIDSLTTEVQIDAYIDLGGKREFYDFDAAHTAIREMNEESNNLFLDISKALVDQIRERKYPAFALPGKKPYWFFCVKVNYRQIPENSKLEWVPLRQILSVTGDKLNNSPISNRLLELLNIPGVKQKLLCL